MAKKVNFVGTYTKLGSKIFNEHHTFILSERKRKTSKKSNQFLLLLNKTTGKRVYISSIYPTRTKDTFKFDHQGQDYTITINDNKATITLFNV